MRRSPLERLMDKVAVNPQTGCWVWGGARAGKGWNAGGGYSAFYFDGRLTSGHRASYIIAKGPIPDGLTIDHLCKNTLCVNPDHLEAVTMAENNARSALDRTHCSHGHLFDEANTYFRPGRAARECRKCRCAVVQRNKAKKLERRAA